MHKTLCENCNEKRFELQKCQEELNKLNDHDHVLIQYLKSKDSTGILFEKKTVNILKGISEVEKKHIFMLKERVQDTFKHTN